MGSTGLEMPGPLRARVPELDGLRGVAIALVLLLHLGANSESPIGVVAAAGWMGVDLFFVLSGYLITALLLEAKGSIGYYRNFYARRALRIFPLYYGTLAIMLLVQLFVRPEVWSGGAYISAHPMHFLTHTENWLIAKDSAATTAQLSGLWSLAIEEQFYLAWPIVIALASEGQLLMTCGVALLVAPILRFQMVGAGSTIETLYAITPTRLDPILAGAMIALLRRRAGLQRWRPLALYAMGCGLLAIELLIAFAGTTAPDIRNFPLLVTALAVFWGSVLVRTLTSAGTCRRAMSAPPLQWLGQYSYAIYMIQPPVHAILGAWGLGAERVGQLQYSLIALPACLGGAFLSWHIWEKRWLALKDRFPRRTAETLPAP